MESALRSRPLAHPIAAPFKFRMLGPLEVSGPAGLVELGGRKQQAVLAVLLLSANRVVSVDTLIEEIWGNRNPLSSKTSLHAYVSRLRRELGERIETRGSDYVLRVDSLELDRAVFERQADLAQEALALGNADLALMRLREGLRLWRDRPLRGLPLGPDSEIEISRLEDLRLTVLEQQVEALTILGRNRDALAELEPLLAQYPYTERLRELRMLGLYRSGRQADALAEYRATRKLLVDELGIEPGPSLQDLHRAILAQDPALGLPSRDSEPRSGRRQATALMAAFLSAEEPEALGASVAQATNILERYQAAVEERAGEGLLAVFGLPTTREDDPLRSLRAAVELVDEVPAISHVAVESGEVLTEGTRLIGGHPLTRISSLSQEAREGDILLGERAQSLVRHYARMSPPSADGARRLVDIDRGAGAIQRHLEGALVGREVELGRLEQTFQAAVAQRSCQLLTILGNPGIGKSKLARAFGERIGSRATVLEGRCPSFGEGITLWPLAEMVRTLTGNLKRNTLQRLLEDEPDARLIAGQLATALGTEESPETAEDLLWALRELFGALARHRPLVLIFEDIQWAKPRLLDLIEQLLDVSQGAPILIACLARLELLSTRPAWGGGRRNSSAILLNPLSKAESRALVRARSKTLSEEQLDKVAERAEGNPLFIEQLLALLEEGGELTPSTLPPSIQAVLAARLDLLPDSERTVLDHASVVGSEFWVRAIGDLMKREEEELRGLVRGLLEKEFLRPARSELRGEEAYRFQHVLLRDVAYRTVPKRVRAELHIRFAAWLEESHPDEGDSDEVAGYHLEQAYLYRKELEPDSEGVENLPDQAGTRYARAGSRALLRSDMPGAIRLLQKVLELWPTNHPQWSHVLAEIAPAYRAMGHWKEVREAVDEGLRKSTNGALAAYFATLRVETELQQGRISVNAAHQFLESQAAALTDSRRAHADHVRISLAWLKALQGGAAEAEKILVRTLKRTPLDPRVKLRAFRLLPSQWLYGPLPAREGIQKCRRLLAREELGPRELAAVNRCFAALTAMQGDIESARALIADEEEKLSKLGLSLLSAGVLLVHAEIEELAGDLETSEKLLRRGLGRLEELGESMVATEFRSSLARILTLRRGRDDEAWALTETASRSTTFDAAVPVQILGTQARIIANDNGSEQAAKLASRAVSLAQKTDLLALQGDAYRNQGDVLFLSGKHLEAQRAWRDALKRYEEKGNLMSAASIALEPQA